MELSRRLMGKFGHQVSWFAPGFANSPTTEVVEGLQIERRGFAAFVHLNTFFRFFQLGRQQSDVYIEDYHGVSLGTALYLRKPVAILVHEVAGPIWFEMFSWPMSWIGFAVEKIMLRLLRRAQFFTVSNSTKKDLIKHGIPEKQIRVFSEASDLAPVSKPLSRAERNNRFVFVGRICKMKRVDLLIKAFAEFRKTDPSVQLLLVGAMDPAFQLEFEALIAALEIGASIRRTGFVSQEDKATILKSSLALVSCSMHEGFGLIVVEANSQGTPALTFDVNGYRDLIKPKVNGAMAPFGDTEAMASQMADLFKMDERRYEALAQSSLNESKNYSWDKSAEEFEKMIASLSLG